MSYVVLIDLTSLNQERNRFFLLELGLTDLSPFTNSLFQFQSESVLPLCLIFSGSTAQEPDARRVLEKHIVERYKRSSEQYDATNCSVIRDAQSLCSTCEQVCHYVPSVSPPRVKCGCYRGYAIGRDWQHCIGKVHVPAWMLYQVCRFFLFYYNKETSCSANSQYSSNGKPIPR